LPHIKEVNVFKTKNVTKDIAAVFNLSRFGKKKRKNSGYTLMAEAIPRKIAPRTFLSSLRMKYK
jgi:hypothetical protein